MTPEASPLRKALTAVILAAALFAAVGIQLTVVNRLPLPAATAPDLILLLVAAIAVATGPVAGAVTGFAGGLALDVAPPAAHYAGEYALVFCLVGYAAASVARAVWNVTGEHDQVTRFTVMAAAVVAGEAGKAAIGALLSDPDVTGATVSRVLPGASLYDLLLAPLAFWLVARVTRGAAAERAPVPAFGHDQRPAGVFRQASAGAAPNLRLAGTGENHRNPSPPRRVPKLRLSGASGGVSATNPASSPGATRSLAGGRTPKLNFAGTAPARAVRRKTRTPGRNWLRAAGTAPAARAVARRRSAAKSPHFKSPGSKPRGLKPRDFKSPSFKSPSFKSRGFKSRGPQSRGPQSPGFKSRGLKPQGFKSRGLKSPSFSSPARPAVKRAPRTPGRGWLKSAGAGHAAARRVSGPPRGFMNGARATGLPGAARPLRSPADALAARSAPSGLSALSGAGTPLARRRSPSRGWLRSSRPATPSVRRRSPSRGWLGSARRPRTVIGSGVRGRTGNRYAGSPSGAWLRRGRRPWRKRGYLPGGRPPVPPGARAMAKSASVSRARYLPWGRSSVSPGARAMARRPRLFGLGGRR